MLNYQSKFFLQSSPIKIIWAGFESDTLRLQNNGWSLAIEDEHDFVFARHRIRFILRHEMLDLHALTDIEEVDGSRLLDFKNIPCLFNIRVMARDIHFRSVPAFNFAAISQIDARPEMVEITDQSIRDLQIFKTLIKPDHALIIEPDQISSLLEKIVACQSPKQAEIKERIRKSDARDNFKQTLHAQILSIAA